MKKCPYELLPKLITASIVLFELYKLTEDNLTAVIDTKFELPSIKNWMNRHHS